MPDTPDRPDLTAVPPAETPPPAGSIAEAADKLRAFADGLTPAARARLMAAAAVEAPTFDTDERIERLRWALDVELMDPPNTDGEQTLALLRSIELLTPPAPIAVTELHEARGNLDLIRAAVAAELVLERINVSAVSGRALDAGDTAEVNRVAELLTDALDGAR